MPIASTYPLGVPDGTETLLGVKAGIVERFTRASPAVDLNARFGFVGDGVSDNNAAWIAFGDWARAESDAGRAVHVIMQPGTYLLDLSAEAKWALLNIRRLYFEGYGAIFQNANDVAPWFASSSQTLHVPRGKLIGTVAVGDGAVTLLTPAEASAFTPGQPVLIASNEMQFYGYPPNPDKFEFSTVYSANATTGVIELWHQLHYAHRADFPDGGNTFAVCGKARIFQLDGVGNPFGAPANTWDIEHEFRGIEIRLAPGAVRTYMTNSGRLTRFVDCIVPGTSQSIAHTVHFINCKITAQSEPDKVVSYCVFDGCDFASTLIPFQSSSIDHVIFRDCHSVYVQGGCAKYIYAENCNFLSWSSHVGGQAFGTGREHMLVNCHVIQFGAFNPASVIGVDTSVSGGTGELNYFNGRFSVKKHAPANTAGSKQEEFSLIPGSTFSLEHITNGSSSDAGTGVVTAVTEDATHIHFDTTLPYASFSALAWTNWLVRIPRLVNFRAVNCTGDDKIRQLSEATSKGKRPQDYLRQVFAGEISSLGRFARSGVWKRVRINVIQPAANGTFEIFSGSAYNARTMVALGKIIVSVDWTVRGSREFTRQAIENALNADDKITLGDPNPPGTAQTKIPTDLFVPDVQWFTRNYSPGTTAAWQLPLVEVEIEFDSGLYQTLIPQARDDQGSPATVVTVNGGLP